MSVRFNLPALALTLSLAAVPAMADITPETRWADPTQVDLAVTFPGDGYHANWELFRCDCGDLLVRSELAVPGETEQGETLLVGGRAMLSRGFGAHQAELGASLDAPALMMQLTLRLLERSEPGGPSKVSEAVEVDLTEEILHINLDTGGAAGGFQAPWSIKGRLAPAGETRRRFDLQFSFSVITEQGKQATAMRLQGVADFSEEAFPIEGSDSLDGWEIVWRDSQDPAAGKARSARTLGELRAEIEANQIR